METTENFGTDLYIKFFNCVYETLSNKPLTNINELTQVDVLKALIHEM